MLSTRTWRPWLLLAGLQLADIATTAVDLHFRAAQEANRTAAAIMSSYGQPAAYLLKATLISFLALALWHYRTRSWARWTLYVTLALSAYAVVNNTAFFFAAK